MDQIEKLKIKEDFTKNLETDIERLTKQLKFLNEMNNQIGGKPAAATKPAAAKTNAASSSGIDLVESQISTAKNISLLDSISKSLGQDLVTKLTSLRDEIKKALEKSDGKADVDKVLKSFDSTIKCLQTNDSSMGAAPMGMAPAAMGMAPAAMGMTPAAMGMTPAVMGMKR